MNFGILAKRAEKLVADNSPAILTAIGVTGVITTAILTARASFKAAEILQDAEEEKEANFLGDALKQVEEEPEPKGIRHISPEPLTTQEKVELVWKAYVPAAGTAALTVAAIICANRIGNRRAAALASAYSMSEKAFKEYRTKVVDKLGKTKEQGVRDEIAQEKIDKNPAPKSETFIITPGGVLCNDLYTGRYFISDMETIRKAVNDTNQQVLNDCYASLTDFYERIGLERTDQSDEIGWNTDELLDVNFSTSMTQDSRPCLTISFSAKPVRGYHRLH